MTEFTEDTVVSAQCRFDKEPIGIERDQLLWWGPRKRETDLSYWTYWMSKCHQYRVTRYQSRYGGDEGFCAEQVLSAKHVRVPTQFKGCEWALPSSKYGFITRIIGEHHTLEGAILLCEKHYMRRKKEVSLTSNKLHILKEAEEQDLHMIRKAPRIVNPVPTNETGPNQEPAMVKSPSIRDRTAILGYTGTAVIRWMGKEGWTWQQAMGVLKKLESPIAVATVKIQIAAGVKGLRGDPAPLSPKQIDQLEALLES